MICQDGDAIETHISQLSLNPQHVLLHMHEHCNSPAIKWVRRRQG
jgi:hypothetical protein